MNLFDLVAQGRAFAKQRRIGLDVLPGTPAPGISELANLFRDVAKKVTRRNCPATESPENDWGTMPRPRYWAPTSKSLRDNERYFSISDRAARLYHLLESAKDDYGRYSADPVRISRDLYVASPEGFVTPAIVLESIAELERACLVMTYDGGDGRRYLQVLDHVVTRGELVDAVPGPSVSDLDSVPKSVEIGGRKVPVNMPVFEPIQNRSKSGKQRVANEDRSADDEGGSSSHRNGTGTKPGPNGEQIGKESARNDDGVLDQKTRLGVGDNRERIGKESGANGERTGPPRTETENKNKNQNETENCANGATAVPRGTAVADIPFADHHVSDSERLDGCDDEFSVSDFGKAGHRVPTMAEMQAQLVKDRADGQLLAKLMQALRIDRPSLSPAGTPRRSQAKADLTDLRTNVLPHLSGRDEITMSAVMEAAIGVRTTEKPIAAFKVRLRNLGILTAENVAPKLVYA